ncbi:FMRFamide receptor [Lingula anatina]|uniref:FMRFamide receptor n=1 Tax=Lingula anatina TaxID=7574 RepID=A0A1S3IR62_LINAN|nr:FMRFamide receptor [Lingula anatina]|eukprot:XP_013400421.1 FMRFamide receptor [Lingula anatina]
MTTQMMYDENDTIISSNTTVATNSVTYSEYKNFYENAKFASTVICFPIVCAVGIVGNILILFILPRRCMRSSNTCYLIGIAAADLVLLVVQVPHLIGGIASVKEDRGFITFNSYYQLARYGISNMCITCTGWLTIAVAVERFIVIKRPLNVGQICTVPRARWITAGIFLVSSALYITNFFEFTPNSAAPNGPLMLMTTLGKDDTYNQYIFYMDTLVAAFIPFILLFIFNALLIYHLMRHRHVRRSLSWQYKVQMAKRKKDKDTQHVTLVVIAIIAMFLLSRSLAIYLNILCLVYGRTYAFDTGPQHHLNMGLKYISNLLVNTNASVNFMLYSIISSKFQRIFLESCACEKKKRGYTYTFTENPISSV